MMEKPHIKKKAKKDEITDEAKCLAKASEEYNDYLRILNQHPSQLATNSTLFTKKGESSKEYHSPKKETTDEIGEELND